MTDSQNIWDDLWGSPEEEAPIKPSTYNSVKLAKYFEERLLRVSWHSGFGMVNLRALAAQLAKWKTRADAATVTEMIDLYMSESKFRGKNPGWQDFLYHAEQIHTSMKTVEEPELDIWAIRQREWEIKHGNS